MLPFENSIRVVNLQLHVDSPIVGLDISAKMTAPTILSSRLNYEFSVLCNGLDDVGSS